MKCVKCHNAIAEGEKFCTSCGEPVTAAFSAAAPRMVKGKPDPKLAKVFRILSVICGLLIVLVIAAFVFSYIQYKGL